MKHLLLTTLLTLAVALPVYADTCYESDVTINQLRPVSGKNPSVKHQNTVELHLDSRSWCGISSCSSNTWRVAIDGADDHLIGAAYMAFAANKKVDLHIDTSIGTVNGICMLTHLTVKHN